MSFPLPGREEVERAITAACKANGWEAKAVDRLQYLGSIVDRIRLEINRARFVVADFTENKHGVYYEAGYAEGRGIPVIYSVHKDSVGDLHFDTKHLNYIVWETPADLEQRVSDRIGAVIRQLAARHEATLTRPSAREVHYQGAEGLSVEKVAQHMGQRSVQTVRSLYLDVRVPPMAVFPIRLG